MEPRCARCGSACELSLPEGDPARWECLECWAFTLLPKSWPEPPLGPRLVVPLGARVLVLAIPSAPLD